MTSNKLSRRDFLKLSSLAPLAWATKSLIPWLDQPDLSDQPNIIILVFDALSANHLSLYGYPRETTPNIDRFAENALVFHNHYSTASFTVPGTASLLTGTYPWTHRALSLGAGITPANEENQIFSALASSHTSLGYAQNKYADIFLYQAGDYLQTHIRNGQYNLQDNLVYSRPIFKKDARIAFSSFEDNIFQLGLGYDGSLFGGPLYRLGTYYERLRSQNAFGENYPRGLPDSTELFILNDLVDGAIEMLSGLKTPALTYLHFFPPHDPYRPEEAFFGKFKKGWQPEKKPIHPLAEGKKSFGESNSSRRFYDEYLASWDFHVSRLFEYLRTSGLLDNSYVIITSDHGELFERGETGHMTPLIFEPLIHVPLIISSPENKTRKDIHTYTSSVDILPTLAHITNNPIPAWAEGELLPELGGMHNSSRSIFTMDAKGNSAFEPLKKLSMSLTRENYRITHYQYSGYENFEFYNLTDDLEELHDLYPLKPKLALDMKAELLQKLADVNRPYNQK